MTMLYGIVSLVGSNPAHVLFGPDGPASITGSEAGPWDMTGVGDGATVIMNPDGETAGATDEVGILVAIDDD